MATVNSTASSQVAYSYLQSKNKISGLVSGMDIDSIMEKLMKAENAQMEKLQQQKQKYEWKRDAYREVNTTLTNYQTKLFDDFGKYSNWNIKTANVSSSSAVNVKTTSGASGNLSITGSQAATAGASEIYSTSNIQQSQMTTATQLGSISTINNSLPVSLFGQQLTSNSTTQDILDSINNSGDFTATLANGKLSLSAKDKQVQLDADTKTALENLGFTLNFGQVSNKLTYTNDANEEKTANSSTKLSALGITSDTSFKIKVGDNDEKTINLASTDTLKDLMDKIKSETGLTPTIADGAISLTSSDKKAIQITNAPNELGFKDSLLTSTTSRMYSSDVAQSTLQGKNTIAELMGGGDNDKGVFTLRTITETGEYKDTEITYNVTDTIDSLVSKINSSSAGATAVFNNGKLSISANNTGKRTDGKEAVSFLVMDSNSTKPTEVTSEGKTTEQYKAELEVYNEQLKAYEASQGQTLFYKLGVLSDPATLTKGEEVGITKGGDDAKLTVNGITYSQSSNSFSVAGYAINVTGNLGTYDANEVLTPTSSPVTVSSTTETDAIVDKVKAFVSSYNELIENLNKRTSEKKQVGYDPLTDAQKAEMTTAEVEKWETAAKAGLLKGDSTLNTVISSMRTSISQYGSQTQAKEMMSAIGITSSKTWSENGKLEIDEDKLRAALEKDPDIVARIFTGDTAQGTKGLISELRTAAQNAVKTIEVSSGKASSADSTYSLGRTISSLSTKIDDWKDRLKDIEDRYWKQFSAMETAIQKANNQSSIFAQG